MNINNGHLDLFSGIGGFALAARWAGFQTVQFIENERYCQKVLQKNFPGVPIHGDIHDFKANKYLGKPKPDLKRIAKDLSDMGDVIANL